MSGPSKSAMAAHHLTVAIRHLYAAAEFARDLKRADSEELALSLQRTAEAARDVRGEIAGEAAR